MLYFNHNYFILSKFLGSVLCCFAVLLASVLYSEEEFDWKILAVRDIEIRYDVKDERIVSEIAVHILNDIDDFQRAISFYPIINTSIIIAPDNKYYSSLVSNYSGVIEFSEAFYSGYDRTIYIRNPRDLTDFSRLRTIVLHEYIHLFIDTQYRNVPLWFHEGMAVFFSGELSFDRELYYAKEFILGNTQPLSEMVSGYPPNRIQWGAFYTKSALALKYLYTRNKEEFYYFWELSEEINDYHHAFFTAFRMTPNMFSNMFEEHLTKRYRIEILLAFTGIIWSLLPLFLLIASIRKRIIVYRIKKQWLTDNESKSDNDAIL